MKIVKESSACLPGYPRTLLDANHENMCKFKDSDDDNYLRLSGLLARWVTELKSTQGSSDEQTVCSYTILNTQVYRLGAKYEQATHSYHTTFSGSNNSGFQLGHNAGQISGFTFGSK